MRSKLTPVLASIAVLLQPPALTYGNEQMTFPREGASSLNETFASALKSLANERRQNRRTEIRATSHFAQFGRGSAIRDYEQFFESIGLRAFKAVQNNKHFVYFEADKKYLERKGFAGFAAGDRVVFVFTVDPGQPDRIATFEVTLLSSDNL